MKNVSSQADPGCSERLQQSGLRHKSFTHTSVTLVLTAGLACAFLSAEVRAQSAESGGIQAYADAVRQATIADRIAAMQHYLELSHGGSLRVDALEFLAWDLFRIGRQQQSLLRAQELLAASPGNPVAIALLHQSPPQDASSKRTAKEQLGTLSAAVSRLSQLSKPEGMVQRNFLVMRQQVADMLNSEIGFAFFALQDYASAGSYLRPAAAADPDNPQVVYALALTLLNQKPADLYNGYWYLARAVNLTEGSAQGQEIAQYARSRFGKDGGKDAGWKQYLASAAAMDAPPSTNAVSSAVETARVRPGAARVSAGHPSATAVAADRSIASAASRDASAPANARPGKKASFGFEDTLREPRASAAPAPTSNVRTRGLAAPQDAVSLGILIETSLLTNRNRPAIVATLKDIVRGLRANDEACILVFSDQLDFEQDLTADDALLEDALNQIRAKRGKALLSGIGFAAGHLKRIGKNSNRVLLVVSDGHDSPSASETLMFRSQISGVRIDSVGLDAGSQEERELLSRLASFSGGKAAFASDPSKFHAAALEITQSLGIAVP